MAAALGVVLAGLVDSGSVPGGPTPPLLFLVAVLLPLAVLVVLVVLSAPLRGDRRAGPELDRLLLLKRRWGQAAPARGVSGHGSRRCRPAPSPAPAPREPSSEGDLDGLLAAKRRGAWRPAPR